MSSSSLHNSCYCLTAVLQLEVLRVLDSNDHEKRLAVCVGEAVISLTREKCELVQQPCLECMLTASLTLPTLAVRACDGSGCSTLCVLPGCDRNI